MKKIKTKKEFINKTFVDEIICDLCKNKIENENYDNDEVIVEARIGQVYPEGDFRDLYIIDVCSGCFLDKLQPLIERKFKTKFREIDNENRYSKHE